MADIAKTRPHRPPEPAPPDESEVRLGLGRFTVPLSGADGAVVEYSGSFRGLCVVAAVLLLLVVVALLAA